MCVLTDLLYSVLIPLGIYRRTRAPLVLQMMNLAMSWLFYHRDQKAILGTT